jgi:outer membrane lipoprotein-sorting protein
VYTGIPPIGRLGADPLSGAGMNGRACYNSVIAGGLLAMFTADGVKNARAAVGRTVKGNVPRVAIYLGLIWLALWQVCQAADDPQAREIVGGVARLFVSQSSTATVEMQIAKADLQRKILMQFWSLGSSNVLVRIRQPQEDAGTAILKVANKTWLYLPKANRTVEMPASMMTTSWMGSHFTLDDLVGQSRLTDDYAIATSFTGYRDGGAVSEYTLTPKPAAAVVWGKITLEVRQADHMPVWQRYYDEDGKLVRALAFSEYKYVSGRLIPTRLVMRPLEQAGEQTTITYENVVFDAPISEDTFSLKNLKQ